VKIRASVSIAISGLVWFNTYVSSAQPNKELYELQERCGKRAAELFKRDYGRPVYKSQLGVGSFKYVNHYSAHLNKCFFILIHVFYPKDKKGLSSTTRTLFELNDNKEYGKYFQPIYDDDNVSSTCQVQDKVCRSEDEWRQLVKPFMED
jgi:hypothetical protein